MSTIFTCLLLLLGFMRGSVATELYMLAFMNITTDLPNLSHLDQLIINAYQANTELHVSTANATLNFDVTVPYQGDQIWGHEVRSTENLVPPVGRDVSDLGIFVAASSRLSIQATKSVEGSADGFLALPLTTKSTEFFLMSHEFLPEGHPTFAVAALEDDTCLSIFNVSGNEYTRIGFTALNAYQVFNGVSRDIDYTGVYVNTSKPVAVYSGHECAKVPNNKLFCDHMQSQVPPVQEWGYIHVVPPIDGRQNQAGYYIRVVASQNDTDITVDGVLEATIQRGTGFFEKFITLSLSVTLIECSKPCQVVQYNTGHNSFSLNDVATDPFMMLIPSTLNYVTELRFHTPNFIQNGVIQDFNNFVSIVVESGYEDQVNLNLAAVSQAWNTVTGAGYSIVTVSITPGYYLVNTNTGVGKMMGFVYGHGLTGNTAYGYPAGFEVLGDKVVVSRLQTESGITTPEPTCDAPFDTTTVPADASLQSFYLTFSLKTPVPTTCESAMTESLVKVFPEVVNQTNWRICQGYLCVNSTDTWLYDISLLESTAQDDQISSVTFRIRMWSSDDALIKYSMACRRHVSYYLRNFYEDVSRWRNPVAVTCPTSPTNPTNPSIEFIHPGIQPTGDANLKPTWRCRDDEL